MKSKLFSTATMESKVFLTATIVVLVLSGFIAFKQLQIKPSSHEEKYLSEFERLPLEDAVGPESFAFDPLGGGPYTGISDGRIIKWQQDQRRWINFATTSPHRYALPLPYLKHPLWPLINPIFYFLDITYIKESKESKTEFCSLVIV
jgi:hypothetical protein